MAKITSEMYAVEMMPEGWRRLGVNEPIAPGDKWWLFNTKEWQDLEPDEFGMPTPIGSFVIRENRPIKPVSPKRKFDFDHYKGGGSW